MELTYTPTKTGAIPLHYNAMQRKRRSMLIRAVAGVSFEYYDYVMFAAFTPFFASQFFNGADPLAATLKGNPADIYDRPRSLFVARFVGESNVLSARRVSTCIAVDGIGLLDLSPPKEAPDGAELVMLLRPERLRVLPEDCGPATGGAQRAAALLERAQYLGHRVEYRLRIGPHIVLAWATGDATQSLAAGDTVILEWDRDSALLFSGNPAE